MAKRLYDFLKRQSSDGRIPFHMPGHMRHEKDYIPCAELDFTEIDGLDDLHAPDGILADAMEYAATVFGARRSFFLVNGSTGGILASVHAVAKGGKTVVSARNCHKSVFNALALCGCDVKYVYPDTHPLGFSLEITPESVRAALEETPDAAAVIITSPTYDGVVSDVSAIAGICHSHGIPLIVDAAHGSHLGFLDPSVRSSVECGADIVINSLHKTMNSLTQTGILHLSSNLVSDSDLSASLAIFETSSPSYVLMASIDGCVHEYADRAMFDAWHRRTEKIRESAKDSAVLITVPDSFAFDESKLIVSSDGYTGEELADILRHKHNIEPEMVSERYVLLMTGAGTSDAEVDALTGFINSLEMRRFTEAEFFLPLPALPVAEQIMKMSDAITAQTEKVSFCDSVGRIAAEQITPYPPGIPLILPGEEINSTVVEYIRTLTESGAKIVTSSGKLDTKIRVIR